MGTSVGTQVFLKYGWRPAAALSVAWSGFTLVVLLLCGPHCKRYTWFGYEGGTNLRKEKQVVVDEEKAAPVSVRLPGQHLDAIVTQSEAEMTQVDSASILPKDTSEPP